MWCNNVEDLTLHTYYCPKHMANNIHIWEVHQDDTETMRMADTQRNRKNGMNVVYARSSIYKVMFYS